MLYKHKESVVEAMRLHSDNITEVRKWILENGGVCWIRGREEPFLVVKTGLDNSIARPGYYILYDGEFGTMKEDRFNHYYVPLHIGDRDE